MAWKKISSKQIYKNKWMEVTEDVIRSDSGRESIFGVVHKNPFALVVPWDGKFLTIIREYRYPVNDSVWGFPMGHFEHNSINETAKEELREEAGLEAGSIKKITDFYLAAGHHTQVCHVFFATDLTEVGQKLEESEEGMEVKKVTLNEFKNMIRNGEIKDGPSVAAFGILNVSDLLK